MKIKLVIPLVALMLTACASFPTASQISATAVKFGDDALGYAQTLGNAIQTLNTAIQADAPTIEAVASSWGLLPANSKQLAVFNAIVSNSAKVSGNVSALNTLLSPTSLANIVATTSPAPTADCFKPEEVQVATTPPMASELQTPGLFAATHQK